MSIDSISKQRERSMKVGSLFTGYGGLDMAVGGELAWYSEINKAACQVLANHHPGVSNLGDITAINWSEVEHVDILTGGYPCQPFSQAGNRKGKNDERHLWPYVLTAIRAIQPEYAILENVAGHVTLGFADVLADLAQIGWAAEWGTYRASDVGAPHRRERIFIVAYADSEQNRKERNSRTMDKSFSGVNGQQFIGGNFVTRSGSNSSRNEIGIDFGPYASAIVQWGTVLGRSAPQPTIEHKDKRRLNPVFVEWMMGLPEDWVTGHGLTAAQELAMLGNGVVPQQAYEAITQLIERTRKVEA